MAYHQYNDDFQEIVGILCELNEHDKKIGNFLGSVDYDPKHPADYFQRICSAEKHEEYKMLHHEKAELDRRWNKAIRALIRKGYTGAQIPSRRDMENFSDWRTTITRKSI